MAQRTTVTFLHGLPDHPTDAVFDYALNLSAALARLGVDGGPLRLPWHTAGWRSAEAQVGRPEPHTRAWLLIQYTAFSWSRRGVPLRLLPLQRRLRRAGWRVGVTFHDSDGMAGDGPLSTARRIAQRRLMRALASDADLAVLTVPREHTPWLPPGARALHLPVGANILLPSDAPAPPDVFTLAVFGITGGEAGRRELALLETALTAAGPPLRVHVFGRGTQERQTELVSLAARSGVEIRVHGLLSAADAGRRMAECSAMLFLRGGVQTNRGSLIAAVCAGLPVICMPDTQVPAMLAEAGLLAAPPGDARAAGALIARLRDNAGERSALAARSRQASERHFAWPAIAARLVPRLLAG